MINAPPERITQQKLILGIFRELLFVEGYFSSEIEKQCFTYKLVDIVEANTRDNSDLRELVLHAIEPSIAPPVGTNLRFQVGFGRYHIEFLGIVTQSLTTTIRLSVPKELEIINQRENPRYGVSPAASATAVALLRTGNLHAEATIIIDNASKEGYGGTLSTLADFPITRETLIYAKIPATHGELSLNARIVRATLTGVTTDETARYNVGLAQLNERNGSLAPLQEERRRGARHLVDEHVTLLPILRSDYAIELAIVKASVTGFEAITRDNRKEISFPIGAQFTVQGTTLVVELLTVEEGPFRFHIIAGSEPDRIKWLKRLSRYIENSASLSTLDAREVLQIFCQAGALSPAYLKSHIPFAKSLLKGIEREDPSQYWVHRWVGRTSQGATTGYISSIKIGDNAWIVGDLVGSQNERSKLSPTFIVNFFRSFRDLSLTLQPCPKHIIMWTEAHPYWRNFERYILANTHGNVFGDNWIGYTRTSSSIRTKTNSPWKATPIRASDITVIEAISEQLKHTGSHALAATLDFDPDRFGSPLLRDAVRASGNRFARYAFDLVMNETRYLLILTAYPLGTSLNRIPESAWLFPLTTSAITLSGESWSELVTFIQMEALRSGIKLPSIRRVIRAGASQSSKLESENTLMRCFICHPSIWNFFDGPQHA